jgi:hypothetical protein
MDEEQRTFTLARLKLAQALLEEADALPGHEGYRQGSEEWWRHPRHEREALVAYLLLTCLDKLGQDGGFTTLADWLRSRRSEHVAERDEVLGACSPDTAPLDIAAALASRHQQLYGVRNAFCRGIDGLPQQARDRLLASIELSIVRNYASYPPGTSVGGVPFEDKAVERDLKIRYLYDKRNRFTHRLEQFHQSSVPLISAGNRRGASWVAFVRDGRLHYGGVQQDRVNRKDGDAYVYTVSGWPFALFESLYEAIGIPFDVTSIKLMFHVKLFHSKHPDHVYTYKSIPHAKLKNVGALERAAWKKI